MALRVPDDQAMSSIDVPRNEQAQHVQPDGHAPRESFYSRLQNSWDGMSQSFALAYTKCTKKKILAEPFANDHIQN
jgi:hypothetical protein